VNSCNSALTAVYGRKDLQFSNDLALFLPLRFHHLSTGQRLVVLAISCSEK